MSKSAEDTETVDLTNLDFESLPPDWKRSNINAAHVIVNEILRHVKTKQGNSNHANKLDLPFIEKAAHYTHQQWIIENEHSSDTFGLIPYYLLPNKTKNLIRRMVRKAIELYDPQKDRFDTRFFPPRAMVVVPLPDIVEDKADDLNKPWEHVGDEVDEHELKVCQLQLF